MGRAVQRHRTERRQDDDARFLKSWLKNPLRMGAVTPSGPALARKMASYVDPAGTGPVVELGPGTGPMTTALVARGIDPARLVLVEYSAEFCRLLRERFPTATIVQGDAYSLPKTLAGKLNAPADAVVSGLPLMTRPEPVRLQLLDDALGLMRPGAPFIQFTYSVVSPVPLKGANFSAEPSERVWRNIPPARVWVYRRGS
ncbi:class I SAM-dependent methyltransferase [Phreatobacter sp.]|uniref:class I SAM-dependent methyltransferase n=1 Tax=Phreatobacter sp. TaxID=1966341 RepID=UPI0025F950CA|nr:methyltransferase domain-containing protein [Phreatobacter sp.]